MIFFAPFLFDWKPVVHKQQTANEVHTHVQVFSFLPILLYFSLRPSTRPPKTLRRKTNIQEKKTKQKQKTKKQKTKKQQDKQIRSQNK